MVQQGQRIAAKVGDIFIASWGYDMVIVDFYEVVSTSASGKTVTVRKIGGVVTQSETCSPEGATVVPVPGDYIGAPVSHRLQGYGDRIGFKADSVSRAYLATEQQLRNGVYECEWD